MKTEQFDLTIRGGSVVSVDGIRKVDVGVQAGGIAALAEPGELPAGRTDVDASGKYVIPGVIDGHVHFRQPGYDHEETFESGSRSAAFGGVTTVCDMPNTMPYTSTVDRLREKAGIASSQDLYCDVGLYGLLAQENTQDLIPLVDAGVVAFKCFLGETIGKIPPPDDGVLIDGLRLLSKTGVRVAFHSENDQILQHGIETLKAEGRTDHLAHVDSRPIVAELEAIQRVGLYARETDARVHIAHLSSIEGFEEIVHWRRRGVDITAETSAHYCFRKAEDMESLGGRLRMNPPIRYQGHGGAPLLAALARGDINAIATDHSPHLRETKLRDNVWDTVSGFAGVEISLRLFLTHAVNEGLMTLPELVRATSYNPSRIWGQFPTKGHIAVGAQADLAVIDLEVDGVIDEDQLHGMNNTTPFNGTRTKGAVTTTICNGTVVMRDGALTGEAPGSVVRRRSGEAVR